VPKTISPRAKRLWQRLIEWYGTRIIEQYGDAPPEDWSAVIDGVDNDQVKRGLGIIRSKHAAHPPTFPQFAEAMTPPKVEQGPRVTTIEERLCKFAAYNYWDMLTAKQRRGPWTYIGKFFAATGMDGKTHENHGVQTTGVVIDADGDSPGYRIMVNDMTISELDWDHPQPPGGNS